MNFKIRNHGASAPAAGQAQPLPVPREGEGRTAPPPTPRAGDGRATPLPVAPRVDDAPGEDDPPPPKSRETYSITKPALDYYTDRAEGHFARFNNMSVAFKLAGRDLKTRIVKTGRVFDLRPPTAFESYIESRALRTRDGAPQETPDVATRRRDWDEAKRAGDAGAMTTTANALMRAVEEARAHLSTHEAVHAAREDGARHPTSEILNPSGSRGSDGMSTGLPVPVRGGVSKWIDLKTVAASVLLDGDIVPADDPSVPQADNDMPPGEMASTPADVADHTTMLTPEQARIVADIVERAPGETRPRLLRDILDRYGHLGLGKVLKSVDADVGRDGRVEGSRHVDGEIEQYDAVFRSPAADEPSRRPGRALELSSPRERPSPVKQDLATTNVAKELQYFSYDPREFEKNFPGWSGPLVVFDDVFPDGLPRPLNRRFFRKNDRGFGGYLVRKNGPLGRPRDYAFLIKGVEISDSQRRWSDVGSLGPGSVGQINEVAEDVYQQMKAQGVFRDIKAGGSLMLTGHSQGAPQAQLLALYLIVRASQDPDNGLTEADALRGIYVRAFGGVGAKDAVRFLRDGKGNPLVVPQSVLDNVDAITYLIDGDPAGSSQEPYVGEAWVVDAPDPSRFKPDEAWARGPLRDHPRSAYRAADYRTARRDKRERHGRAGNPRFRPRRDE